jgi:gluconolactonase
MPELTDVEVLADGLVFPEGPVALADGSVLVVEVGGGRLTRVAPDGEIAVVAEVGGGPNGAARGPDGAVYLCNNGRTRDGVAPAPPSIQRVDLDTGAFDVLYQECDGVPFAAPNDLVFDRTGGFWFTDITGGSVYYAAADGSAVDRVWTDLSSPNGVGLSPEEDVLYSAQTFTRQVLRRRISSPGKLTPSAGWGVMAVARTGAVDPDVLVAGLPGAMELDSLAVDGAGAVCVGTLVDSGITVVEPDGTFEKHTLPSSLEDPLVTNICFGGADLQTAYITLALTGRLVRCPWPRPGLRLNFQQ